MPAVPPLPEVEPHAYDAQRSRPVYTVAEPERAIEPAEAALELCAVTGDRHREAALHNNLADLMHETGRHEEAMAHLKAAVEIFAAVGTEAEPRPEIWKLVRW